MFICDRYSTLVIFCCFQFHRKLCQFILFYFIFVFYILRRIQREEEAINARKEAEEVRTCTCTLLYCTIYIPSSALHLLLCIYVCSMYLSFHLSFIILIYYSYSEDSRGSGSGGTKNTERLR